MALLAALATQAQNNTSVVSQTGNTQSATAVQAGSYNESTILQQTGISLTPNVGNIASTSQTANGSASQSNQAFIKQLDGSFYNTGSIKQQGGSGNSSTIEQIGNASFGSGGTGAGEGNRASISQTGSGNQNVLIRQNTVLSLGGSQSNTATISQVGNDMDAGAPAPGGTVIEQNNLSIGNSASINQGVINGNATANTATIRQNTNSQRNTAAISQEQSGNSALLLQRDISADNKATIMQLGMMGTAVMTQANQSTNNQSTLTQQATSNGSFGTIDQSTQSYYNRATLEQAGTTDAALISQSNESANNDALIKQGVGGTGNLAAITQINAYAGASAGASTALGAANSATITQNQTTVGKANFANIQQGSIDISPATGTVVVSTGNQASMAQENDMNVADLIQVGVSNKAGVVQNGYSTLKGSIAVGALTTDTAGQFGSNNTLTVQQTGTSVSPQIGNITQIGTGNVGGVYQTASVLP